VAKAVFLAGKVRLGSKPEKLNASRCFPLFIQQRTWRCPAITDAMGQFQTSILSDQLYTISSDSHSFGRDLMKLFYAPGSSSLFPHIVLREAELPFQLIRIDEHTKAISDGGDSRGVNPLGYVPALVLDDGTLLTEGAAIVQFIADLAPEKKLAPPNGTIERSKLQAWLNFFASELHKGGFSPLSYKGVPEEGRDVFRSRLRARFAHLDEHLSSNEYLMGSNYSVADAHFFVVSNWASWVSFDLIPYPAVLAHRQKLATRPAVITALKTEGLVPWPATQPH